MQPIFKKIREMKAGVSFIETLEQSTKGFFMFESSQNVQINTKISLEIVLSKNNNV